MTSPIVKSTIKVIWEATPDGQLDPKLVEGNCVASESQRKPNIKVDAGTYFMQATHNTGIPLDISQNSWLGDNLWKKPISVPAGQKLGKTVTRGAVIPVPDRGFFYPEPAGGGYFPPGTTIALTLYPL